MSSPESSTPTQAAPPSFTGSITNRIRAAWKRSFEKRVYFGSSGLPWLTFVWFPIPAALAEIFIILLGLSLADKHYYSSPTLSFFIYLPLATTSYLPVIAWPVCLVLFFWPKLGHRSLYCWLPLLAYAAHILCMALACGIVSAITGSTR